MIEKTRKQARKKTPVNEKWIHNASKHTLTAAERSVLSKGLNYAVTPKNIPYEDFILATELACEKYRTKKEKQHYAMRLQVFLKTARPPPSNITKEEARAIKSLTRNKEITILPADKGRATVILDTEKYEEQMRDMLNDTNTYEDLKKYPTEEKKNKLKALLKPLLNDNKIKKQTYNHLLPTANIAPCIYRTPKIHKPGTPLCPIVNSIRSVTDNLSKAVAEIIKPLLGQSK